MTFCLQQRTPHFKQLAVKWWVVHDEKNKELTIRTVFAEFDSLYMCPECEEDFEEALVYIEDYKKGETYTCPYCGETITFDATECITKIKLEEFNNKKEDEQKICSSSFFIY